MSSLDEYLNHASLWLVYLGLLLSELGLPIPETVFVVAAGVLSERAGQPIILPILFTCLVVAVGDVLLFALARRFGMSVFSRRPFRWLVPERAYPRIDALFERHGPMAIFAARFISGVRGAAFVLAGMRRMPLLGFLLWDGLAILVTVPVFALLGYGFSSSRVALQGRVSTVNTVLLVALAVILLAYGGIVVWRQRTNRRS